MDDDTKRVIDQLTQKIKQLQNQALVHSNNLQVLHDAQMNTNTAAGTLATAAGNASATASVTTASTKLGSYQSQ